MLKRCFQNPKIRKLMLIQALICVILVLLSLGTMYYMRNFTTTASKQVAMESAENRMHVTVENVIRQITLYDKQKKEQYEGKLDRNEKMLQVYQGDVVGFVREWLTAEGTGSESMPIEVLVQRNDGTVLIKTYEGDLQPESAAVYRLVQRDGVNIWFFVTQAMIDSAVKSEIYAYIHNQTYNKNDYVWVNEVVNYQGGENYAVRRIHPNLKHTEGMYLSTDLSDSVGAHPYESELEGIKKDGEIFQDYYFKNLSDDKISKKYSYAKLYKPFDWIIATGVPESDIFAFTDVIQQQQRIQLIVIGVMSLLMIFLTLGFGAFWMKRDMEIEIARNSAKSILLSRASHDMRTPLNAIINFSNKDFAESADVGKLHEYMESINDSARYQLSLINDLLTMAKFEKDSFTLYPRPTQAVGCLKRVEQMMRLRMVNKQIHFTVQWQGIGPDDFVLIDSMRVEEILLNLLTNAAKFTPEGGHVVCRLNCTPRADDWIDAELSVKDDGVGIDSKHQKAIFEPFVQHIDTNSGEQIEGAGLGLSIVKELVEAMNGQIELTSSPGNGSTFHIILPWKRCTAETVVSNTPEDFSELRGKRVLICEDNELNIVVLQGILGHVGVLSDVAKDGKHGVELFEAAVPGYYAAILMDNLMPIMNGVEATLCIRKLSRSDAKTIPVIAVSANAYEEDKQKAVDAQMDAYVVKPIEPMDLYKTLQRLIK